MIRIFYPKQNGISLFSNFDFNTNEIRNNFIGCSISVYDDEGFRYVRQNYNDIQILSLLPSDDSFSFSELDTESILNYLIGKTEQYKIFYIKILVNKNIELDELNSISSFYTLSVTKIFGSVQTKYYPVTCIEKNQFYTVYSSSVSFYESDFVQNSDCKIIFNLIGDYNVTLNYPISISTTNASYTPISQSSSASTKTIPQSENSAQYFTMDEYNFLSSSYSNTSNFSFIGFSFPDSQNLFSSESALVTSSSNSLFIRFDFPEGVLESELKYFGLTFSKTDSGYVPANDSSFSIVLRNKLGKTYRKDASKIYNNSTSQYYNVVFKLKDLSFSTEYVDYVVIELITLDTSMINPYIVTFLSFLTTGYTSFSSMSVSTLSKETTVDPFGENININDLLYNQPIGSINDICTANSIIKTKDQTSYTILTAENSVTLPDNSYVVSGDNRNILIEELLTSDIIKTISGNETVLNIIIGNHNNITIIDNNENRPYCLNGVYVKNPLFLQNFTRTLLKSRFDSRKTNKFISINDSKYFVNESSRYYTVDKGYESKLIRISFGVWAPMILLIIKGTGELLVKYKEIKKRFNLSDNNLVEIDFVNDNSELYIKSEEKMILTKIMVKKKWNYLLSKTLIMLMYI